MKLSKESPFIMAKHSLFRATKFTAPRLAIGAAVLAGSLIPFNAAAHADPAPSPEKHVAALGAPKSAVKAAPKAQVKALPTAASVLALAKAQVGTKENANGGGTKFQKWYADSQRAAETVRRDGGNRSAYLNAAWCSMFVSWVGEHTGARPQVGWDAYTVTHAKWFKNNNRWGTQAKPGAVVFFAWDGGKSISSIQHVGFVQKDNGNGTITTIEGNTGNGAVEERVRPKSQVVGYGYPSYGG
ncbi:CHAP domain-containing protein [Nonomuraea sp. NPDC046570]|uniref:CHAP domain-containing protein n=1 Tax=Nonomuraea sp. NPDC046570 TaxID=3155255 RepID=UPI0034000DCF